MLWAPTRRLSRRFGARSSPAVPCLCRCTLVGPQERIRPLLHEYLDGERLPIHIIHASEHIGMNEKAAQRSSHPSATAPCVLACAWFEIRKSPDFSPPAIPAPEWLRPRWCSALCPGWIVQPWLSSYRRRAGSPCVLLDVGANVDCKPQNLEQFAVMGEMYARSVLKISRPRVGLLSIGEEEGKGNELTARLRRC